MTLLEQHKAAAKEKAAAEENKTEIRQYVVPRRVQDLLFGIIHTHVTDFSDRSFTLAELEPGVHLGDWG